MFFKTSGEIELGHKPKKSAEYISLKSIILIYLSNFSISVAIRTKLLEMEEMNERDLGLDFFQSLVLSKATLLSLSEGLGLDHRSMLKWQYDCWFLAVSGLEYKPGTYRK